MGKEVRQGLANENAVPGPGKYNTERAVSHGAKFGKAYRDTVDGGKNDVGPGAYNWNKNGVYSSAYSFGKDKRKAINDPVIFFF